ncbi:MAG: hypothetical protein RIG62_17715 [Cyclobacteriaceae bacterium]
MKPIYTLSILLAMIFVVQCTSSKKLLEQGNYYEAVIKATEKLRKSPNNKKAQAALRQAYPLAIDYLLDDIRRVEKTNDAQRWSTTATIYQQLNGMYEAIQTSPQARRVVSNPRSFYEQYGVVKNKAAQEQYTAGERELRKNTIESARQAYWHFQQARQYVAGYKNVDQKLAEAKDAGTLRVVVETQPVPSRYYQVSADFFYDQVRDYLRNYERGNEFIAFYQPQEARRIGLDHPDHIVNLQFEDFAVGQSRTLQKEETVTSADSVKVGEVEIDIPQKRKSRTLAQNAEQQLNVEKHTSKRPVYDKVTAKLITTRVEISSGGILGLTVVDGGNNRVLHRDDLQGEHLWFAEWARYQGDKRALTEEQMALCNLPEAVPPPPQQLFVEFTKPLYDQFTASLNRFYRDY